MKSPNIASADDIVRIQACLKNTLDRKSIGKKRIAGIIGDAPSHYSKSPALWNATFRAFGIDAVYLPFDVNESQLPRLVRALKASDRVMGVNVTVPYKVKIMEYLDGLDEKAKQIKAVNTVVRAADGRLLGASTDGRGFLESILAPQPGQERPFVQSLKNMDVLIIGAGGSARAVVFSLAEAMEKGQILICNRTLEAALSLAEEVKKISPGARGIREDEIALWAARAGLIVNCSTKGQGGIRKLSNGRNTVLEPYSALAPANPAAVPESPVAKPAFYREWLNASLADIETNNRASLRLALSIPLDVAFCDLVYFPEETVFLRHGRLSGHRTVNGKGMIVAQAAAAFFDKICRMEVEARGWDLPDTYKRIIQIMHEAWYNR